MYIFVEEIQDKEAWGKRELIAATDEIKDEYDYFTKYKPLKNRVVKYEFYMYPIVNGVQQKNNNFQFNPHDQIEV
jgi:hypothetical protein